MRQESCSFPGKRQQGRQSVANITQATSTSRASTEHAGKGWVCGLAERDTEATRGWGDQRRLCWSLFPVSTTALPHAGKTINSLS